MCRLIQSTNTHMQVCGKKNETNSQSSNQKNNAGKMNWIGDLKNAIE